MTNRIALWQSLDLVAGITSFIPDADLKNWSFVAKRCLAATIHANQYPVGTSLKTLVLQQDDYCGSAVISPDGVYVASMYVRHPEQGLKIWNTKSDRPPEVLRFNQCLKVHDFRHHWVISSYHDVKIHALNILSGANLNLLGHTRLVQTCTVAVGGTRLVSGAKDATVRIWNLLTATCLHVLKQHTDWVCTCAVSRDATHIVSGSSDHTLCMWDMTTGQCLHELNGHTDIVEACTINPIGDRVVSGSYDHTLRIWDMRSGQCLHVLHGHSYPVSAVAISPDGARIVSGSGDWDTRIWDMRTGQCLHILRGHRAAVTLCVISSDGAFIVSGGNDATLRVWEMQTGQCVQMLRNQRGPWNQCAISPDGAHIVSITAERCISVLAGPSYFVPHPMHAIQKLPKGGANEEFVQRQIRAMHLRIRCLRAVAGSADLTTYVNRIQQEIEVIGDSLVSIQIQSALQNILNTQEILRTKEKLPECCTIS